jgi:hypothetical protein
MLAAVGVGAGLLARRGGARARQRPVRDHTLGSAGVDCLGGDAAAVVAAGELDPGAARAARRSVVRCARSENPGH